MSTAVRYDRYGLVLMKDEGESVFAADPAGRIWMVYESGTTYKRSRLNRWHKVVRDPWPSLASVDLLRIESRLPDWITF